MNYLYSESLDYCKTIFNNSKYNMVVSLGLFCYPEYLENYPVVVSGSCFLVKYKNQFYAITAKHIMKNIDKKINPFAYRAGNSDDESKIQVLFEKRIWTNEHIEIESDDKSLQMFIDDLCIIELSVADENPTIFKEYYINLDDELIFSKIKNSPTLSKRELVIASGFPNKDQNFKLMMHVLASNLYINYLLGGLKPIMTSPIYVLAA